jgi:16S rRNA (cytosine1402-N4)-methyltransferase
MSTPHQTVLLHEAVESLVTNRNGIYVDATFGRGGHSAAVLECLSDGGRLIAVDKDPQAVAAAQQRFVSDRRFGIIHASFSQLKPILQRENLCGQLDGILLDLGVSSPQLDQAERGFSFLYDGPLDMRMNPQTHPSAGEWIATASLEEMASVFRELGEERYAQRIAAAITRERDIKPITTTVQLAKIVSEANPAWEKHKHPATRVFQAIRIFVNRELEDLGILLADVIDLLKVGGRLVVISFHSLEDRIVKNFIRNEVRGFATHDRLPARLPVQHEVVHIRLRAVGKSVRASDAEIAANPRARSAIMRVAERVA